MDAEDSKFLGMECSSGGVASPGGVISLGGLASPGGVATSKGTTSNGGVTSTQGQLSPAAQKGNPSSIPVLERENVVETVRQNEVEVFEGKSVENGIVRDEKSENEISDQNETQTCENQMFQQNQIANENQNGNQDEIQNGNQNGIQNGNQDEIQNGNQDESQNNILNEILKAEMKGDSNKPEEIQTVETNSQEVEPTLPDHTPSLPKTDDDIIQVSSPTIVHGEGVAKSDSVGEASSSVSGVSAAEVEEVFMGKESSGHSSGHASSRTSSCTSHGSRGGSFSKWDLAGTINLAAQTRSSRENSIDRKCSKI